MCTCSCVSSLMCVHSTSPEEWKSISYQRLYCIICVIYCTICLRENIAFKEWWCLQDYTISKELSDPPPPQQWNEIYLTCYLSYVYTLFSLRFILGFTSSPEIILKKLLHTLFVLSYSCLLCLSSFTILFISLIATFLLSLCRSFSVCLFSFLLSVCRWTNLVKPWTTRMAPSPL